MTSPDVKAIPITPSAVLTAGTRISMGPIILGMPEGQALCHDAVSLTSITAENVTTGERMITLIAVANFDGHHLGVLSPMTPAEARSFAASMILSANQINGGANG